MSSVVSHKHAGNELFGTKKLRKYLEWMRCCCHCGSKAERGEILCSDCGIKLHFMKLSGEEVFERRGDLKCYSLWEWTDERILQSLVLALKIKEDPLGLWRRLAEDFLLRRNGAIGPLGAIVVPPPRPGWRRDHAGHFGHALAGLIGVPCLEILSSPNNRTSQKLLSRQLRKSKVYHAEKKLPKECRPVVWVDDVVTTGYTARAGLKALGLSPSEVELWCLVRRRTLAY